MADLDAIFVQYGGGKPVAQMTPEDKQKAYQSYQAVINAQHAKAAQEAQQKALGLQGLGQLASNPAAIQELLARLVAQAGQPQGPTPGVPQNMDYEIAETTVPPTVEQLAPQAPPQQFACAGCGDIHPGIGGGPMANLCPMCATPQIAAAPQTVEQEEETLAVSQPTITTEEAPPEEEVEMATCHYCDRECANDGEQCAVLTASDKLKRVACTQCFHRGLIELLDKADKARKKKTTKKKE